MPTPLGGAEVPLLIALALLLFGSKKLPELARSVGQSLKEFKKSTREAMEDDEEEKPETAAPPGSSSD